MLSCDICKLPGLDASTLGVLGQTPMSADNSRDVEVQTLRRSQLIPWRKSALSLGLAQCIIKVVGIWKDRNRLVPFMCVHVCTVYASSLWILLDPFIYVVICSE